MPLQIPDHDYEILLTAVGRFPVAASLRELLELPEITFPKRTLQRRLDQLVTDGRLQPIGGGRSHRYRLVKTPASDDSVVIRDQVTPYKTSRDWLSPEGMKVREAVNRPRAERTPAGYNGDFLDGYFPNETFYLPEPTRRRLAELGEVGFNHLPAGTFVRQVMDRLLIDLSWNSSRLEGNTYSLLETQLLLERGEGVSGKAAAEAQMILNHKAAIEMMAEQASEIGFNRYTICNLHALLAENLLPDSGACGRIRSCAVGIGGTVFYPLEVPQLIEERFLQILEYAESILDPFEQSFFVMVHLPYLQPFEDVNKRVSRLAANIPLIRRNLCPLSFVDVEQADYVGGLIGVYEMNRIEYLRDVFVWAYQRSCARYPAVRQTLGEPDPFRLRHRSAIGEAVREVVRGGMDKSQSAASVRNNAEALPSPDDHKRFIEVVESELVCLHEGNIARYRLRPSEFTAWSNVWK